MRTDAVSGVRGLTVRVSDPAMGAPRAHQTLGGGGGSLVLSLPP